MAQPLRVCERRPYCRKEKLASSPQIPRKRLINKSFFAISVVALILFVIKSFGSSFKRVRRQCPLFTLAGEDLNL